MRRVGAAVVGVRGWHTERFYASTFETTPDILRFVESDSIDHAAKLLNCTSFAKVLCLPRLPATGELKEKTIETLREKGVDGVIPFRTMLLELVHHVDVKRNYEKSDLLQVIRLLKNYDLLKADQMEFFEAKRRRRRRRTGGSHEGAEE